MLGPWVERQLLEQGYGITNLVARATAGAAELDNTELIRGKGILERKAKRYAPRWVAVVGIGAYRVAFARPRAHIGAQPETLGPSRIWVLPNPSGLNANHQLPELGAHFRALKRASER